MENAFAGQGLIDLSGPVVRLQSLTPEDLLVLLATSATSSPKAIPPATSFRTKRCRCS
ncbi:MAG: ATP-binding protein [Brevundimonas sp.]|nr:ATP-binding protein [Brevundimonas sp.]